MRIIFAALLFLVLSSFVLAASTESAALLWTAPTTNTDGTAITATLTYNIYQGPSGSLVKVQSGVSGNSATVTTGLTAGSVQCFAVTAIANGVEGPQSNSACVTIPSPSPSAPTNLTITLSGIP
jgi:hypothetical protein